MKRIVMAMVGLAVMAAEAQTFSSTAFRVDTRQNAGVRTAADSEMIYASSLWQSDYSAASCVATVTHTPPGGSVEQLYSTSTAGIEGFVWDAKKAVAGDHLFTHTIRRGASVVATQTMRFNVPEPTIKALRIFGPTSVYSGNTATYTCMGYFSDDSGREVEAVWAFTNVVSGVTIDNNGLLTAGNVTKAKTVGVMATASIGGVVVSNVLDVTIEPPYLTLGARAVDATKDADEYSVTVKCSGEWTASVPSDCDWITFTSGSGTGDGMLVISVAKNTTAEVRKSTVTVTSGSKSAKVSVAQDEGAAIVKVTVSFDAQGGTTTYSSHEYSTDGTYGTLPTAKMRGYVFGGWWTHPDGRGKRIIAKSEVDESITKLYAYWTEMTVAYALNGSLDWANTSKVPWVFDYDTTHDGEVSMRSGAIGDRQSTELALYTSGRGTLTFWWKVSCEEGGDWVSFYVDDEEWDWMEGFSDWLPVSYTVEDEEDHVFVWEYNKDKAYGEGEDCAWLDSVVWMPDYAEGEIQSMSAQGHSAPQAWLTMNELEAGELDEDNDGDGMSNWEEYVAGSNPNDATSALLVRLEMKDGIPEITPFPYVGNSRTYIYEGKASLTDTKWEEADETKHHFFRIRVELNK